MTVTEEQATLTVGDVAQLSGVNASAVRFYEARGLISSVRTSGNQRRYAATVPCVVRVVRVAQRVGLTVEEIAGILATATPDPSPQAWQRVADQLVVEAEARMAELRTVLTDLRSGTRLCDLPPRS